MPKFVENLRAILPSLENKDNYFSDAIESASEVQYFLPDPLDKPKPFAVSSAYINRAASDAAIAWLNGKLTLRGGFFITEQQSVDVYTGVGLTALNKKGRWLQGAIELQLFADEHMPFHKKLNETSLYDNGLDSHLVNNYGASFQFIPSALFFLGSEQEVNDILSFREGIETKPYFILRQGASSSGWFPITVGASAIFEAALDDRIVEAVHQIRGEITGVHQAHNQPALARRFRNHPVVGHLLVGGQGKARAMPIAVEVAQQHPVEALVPAQVETARQHRTQRIQRPDVEPPLSGPAG